MRSSNAERMLTPARRRGIEILDDPAQDPKLAVRSLRDVALANRLFGGRRAVVRELQGLIRSGIADRAHADRARRQYTPTSQIAITLLDVGTGLGDIPKAAADEAESFGLQLITIGLEVSPAIAKAASTSCTHAIVGDAMRLPFADGSIDIVTCSQLLHHFDGAAADALLRECNRVARMGVVVGDLRRSWLAIAGLWSVSFLLRFHPVSRHDGVVSILRGYTTQELRRLVRRISGTRVIVRRRFAWRVTATWIPGKIIE